ncbi:F-box protein At5g51370-like [Cornus florida]|uniref:F-box protein At5g51370-like n=1 Tax=Cornus florida TaxID=4283 RepID=UPI00289DE22C|nr:F-box protein At5g51370-like [Cornus florida]
MPLSPKGKSQPPLKKRPSWSDIWFRDQELKHVFLKMRLHSLSDSRLQSLSDSRLQSLSGTPPSEPEETLAIDNPTGPDSTSLLSDQLLLIILSKLPQSQHISNSLVCRRWSKLSGRLVSSVKLLDWDFLESGRLVYRFPNLTDIDLVRACLQSTRNSGILLTHKLLSIHLDSGFSGDGFIRKQDLLHSNVIDAGLRILIEGCANLRKLVLIGASKEALSCVAECLTLQELELHCCADSSLGGISGCQNLQILKLIGCVDGFYNAVISDIGLTIVAQGCRRLVKLELVGNEGSYDGIKAIGQCCPMLEELTLFNHRMDGGWLAALSFCGNLKTLKLQHCKSIDLSPWPDEHLGSCLTLEELHLQGCHMRDKQGVRALFLVCETVRELVFEDCWGLDNHIFSSASICRRVRLLSLHGCSLLSAEGLDSVIHSWKELKTLRVVSCNNIKDSEVTPALAALFPVLKELKWRPDSISLLSSGLVGTGVRKKGGRSFKRT